MGDNFRSFRNAPVSKFMTIAAGGLSLWVGATNTASRFRLLPYTQIVQYGHWWRLFTSQAFFGSTLETALGCMLLYNLRNTERIMGSRKFGSIVFITTVLASSLQLASSVMFNLPSISPGPFAMLGVGLYSFFHKIPSTSVISVAGIPFSNKVFTYSLAAHLTFSMGQASLMPMVSSLLAAAACNTDLLPLSSLRIPQSVCSFLRATLGKAMDYPPAPLPPVRLPSDRPVQEDIPAWAMGGTAPVPGAEAAAMNTAPGLHPLMQGTGGMGGRQAEPSAADIQQLVEMGFGEDRARGALLRTNGDVHMAAEVLLTGS